MCAANDIQVGYFFLSLFGYGTIIGLRLYIQDTHPNPLASR